MRISIKDFIIFFSPERAYILSARNDQFYFDQNLLQSKFIEIEDYSIEESILLFQIRNGLTFQFRWEF